MDKQGKRNIRLGAMVIAGTLFLLFSLYFIGKDQSLLRSTITVFADFKNVNGLMKGNSVRFAGIDIGSVKSVEIQSDTTVRVTFVIKENATKYLKKNVIASIGSDGLMGNKIVNLTSVDAPASLIQNNDVIHTIQPIETDDLFRKLSKTNDDISIIAQNIRLLTEKFNHPDALISILGDTTISDHIRSAVVNVKLTSLQTAKISGDLSNIVKETKEGKGIIGSLLTDTSFTDQLSHTIITIKNVSDTLAEITGDFRYVSQKLKNGEGAIGAILTDTTIVPTLNRSLANIEKTGDGANQIIEALKQSFLFRGYFKKKAKEKEKEKKQ